MPVTYHLSCDFAQNPLYPANKSKRKSKFNQHSSEGKLQSHNCETIAREKKHFLLFAHEITHICARV